MGRMAFGNVARNTMPVVFFMVNGGSRVSWTDCSPNIKNLGLSGGIILSYSRLFASINS